VPDESISVAVTVKFCTSASSRRLGTGATACLVLDVDRRLDRDRGHFTRASCERD